MIETVVVVIPANNEQALIGSCLDAIRAARVHARDTFGGRVDIRTVVVLDSCIDATASQVALAHEVQTVDARFACAGSARALGVEIARRGMATEPSRIWVASTDADSRVPVDWITTMVRCADSGADVVLGTVRPDVARTSTMYRQWRRRYVPADGHPHVHGANLGLRADVYDRIGGWPSLACDEDVELVRRAEHGDGVKVVRTGAMPVLTSARRLGRAPHGFAGFLCRLPADNRHDDVLLRPGFHLDLPRGDPARRSDG